MKGDMRNMLVLGGGFVEGTKTPPASLEPAENIINLSARLARPFVWSSKRQAERLFIRPKRHHIGNVLKLGEDIRRQRPRFHRADVLFHFLYRPRSH